jgi:alkanesulfonate monooxygenase SsuD/methylene tetrahydromethanopterin reductase-like flavin-dependent oxidoreductase (luciferase family)
MLFTWDHFIPLRGDTSGPALEGWQILPAWGALTQRIRLGVLVSGNTYRHPAILAKMAATLDHITHGRAILGLGAAWNETEHRMYGIAFDTPGVRLAKMDEAARLIRSLLEEHRTDLRGKHYSITNALAEPKPVQRRIPLLIGGGGERKTLRSTAKYADLWHGFGTPAEIRHKIEVLHRHCQEVGRDPEDIEVLSGFQPVPCIRDSETAVDEWRKGVAKRIGLRQLAPRPLHRVDDVVNRLMEYRAVGVDAIVLGMGAPYDRETLERFAREVRPKFEALAA